jgi:hypothetical protein
MKPTSALRQVLTSPTPEALWDLRADLLERGEDPGDAVFEIIDEFHRFLESFTTLTSSRDLNHLASKLDISAIGGVLVEQLFERSGHRDMAMHILTGGLSEGLMVLASRQYVRAAEGELCSLLREVAWVLYPLVWRWTVAANPDLAPDARRELIDRVIAAMRDDDVSLTAKAILAGRLFQILLLAHLSDAVAGGSRPS